MVDLVPSPWSTRFESLVSASQQSLLLCTPFLGEEPCRYVADHASTQAERACFDLLIVTDLSRDNMINGTIDVTALRDLKRRCAVAKIRFLPSVHAKVYVADGKEAVVTSSNMTRRGLRHNFEYGVRLTDARDVSRIKEDLEAYASLATLVSLGELEFFADMTTELRAMRRRAERAIKSTIKREFDRRLESAQVDILRIRAAGRAFHTILADAILYVLRAGPAPTVAVHERIKEIHPDLCDDTVERVIDGKRFGKKWKHAVRTAQQDLKRRGEIQYAGGLWQLIAK